LKGVLSLKLYEAWEALAAQERSEKEHQSFWQAYLLKEQHNYEKMLGEKNTKLTGTIAELAEANDMDAVTYAGFLDGINTSLVEAVTLEDLEETTAIDAEVDFEKLYFNMLDAKAEWLYNLPAWEEILSEEKRREIKKEFNKSKTVVKDAKIGRNDPCPCGSGKKYKKCCGA
jgi:uncharacterized protein YecA (UPF0149 family)